MPVSNNSTPTISERMFRVYVYDQRRAKKKKFFFKANMLIHKRELDGVCIIGGHSLPSFASSVAGSADVHILPPNSPPLRSASCCSHQLWQTCPAKRTGREVGRNIPWPPLSGTLPPLQSKFGAQSKQQLKCITNTLSRPSITTAREDQDDWCPADFP